MKWLPRAPKQALCVLAVQVAAVLAAMAPVYLCAFVTEIKIPHPVPEQDKVGNYVKSPLHSKLLLTGSMSVMAMLRQLRS